MSYTFIERQAVYVGQRGWEDKPNHSGTSAIVSSLSDVGTVVLTWTEFLETGSPIKHSEDTGLTIDEYAETILRMG